MKLCGALKTPSLVLAVQILSILSAPAAPDEDTLSRQKAAIAAVDEARQEYLKTGDVGRFQSKLNQPAQILLATTAELKTAHDSATAGVGLQKLGEICRLQNNCAAATGYFQSALAEAKTAGDKKTAALALIGEGRCELGSKDYKSAARHFREAAEHAATLSDRAPLFNALSWEAQVNVVTGDLVGGADLLARACALGPQLQDQSLLLFAYLDRADIFEKLADISGAKKAYNAQFGSLESARADYEAAQKLARQFGYAGLLPQIEQFQRHLALRRQMAETNIALAKRLAQSSVFAPKKPGDVLVTEKFVAGEISLPPGLIGMLEQSHMLDGVDARGLVTRGNFEAMQGNESAALADYLKAADALEADRRNLSDQQSREQFFNDKIAFYYPGILTLLEQKRFPEAFALMERSRSRAMTDLIFGKKLGLSQPNEQSIFSEAQRLRAEIAAQQKKLIEYRARPDQADLTNEIKAAEEQIARLEEAERKLNARIAKEAPHLRDLTPAQPPASLDLVQAMLRQDASEMLYYLALDDGLILWHIAGQDQHARSVLLPRSELKAKVATLRASVASRDAKFDEKTARELFLYCIQPALGWIKGHHLILVSHAEMNHIPFAALIAPSGESLGEMFALSDAPNAGLLLGLERGDPIGKGRLFAAADPGIEEARSEVEAVAAAYPDRNQTTANPLVAESEVKAVAGQYDVLHLSVHGKFTPLEPMLSYLQLGQDEKDDGRLTAAEMFGLSLRKARLVVLSACETGESEATPGNEILGMERALLYAGANNLVLSQWQVDADSTALWMKTFHEAAQTKPLAEAARLALIETKKKYPQPYYWAAFRLVGR